VSVEVTVCVCWSGDENGGGSSDASQMISRACQFEVAPALGDEVEILPARYDGDRQTHSAWHERVERRYHHRSERPGVEVHVTPWSYVRQLTAMAGEKLAERVDAVRLLREDGYA
jgi:hypothetical protein